MAMRPESFTVRKLHLSVLGTGIIDYGFVGLPWYGITPVSAAYRRDGDPSSGQLLIGGHAGRAEHGDCSNDPEDSKLSLDP